eukprot:1701899-Prymnesium_polylepis.1
MRQVRQRTLGCVEQSSAVECQLEQAGRAAAAAAAKQGERSAWYAQVGGILCSLAGVSGVSPEGSELRYELPSGHSLAVFFAPGGELAGASLDGDDAPSIADVTAHGVRTNSL